ncbi:Protein kinase [Vigna unguiculata]|uniref:Protein kinase n=1 Tax=Vigna unguiculata TaxID=3917 RepID=A0A4D6NRW9_VIGUN|nr:Protein kinase [Vigna unguiculata]
MPQTGPTGEPTHGGSGGRKVVVGVKMDSPSKELLTWALVKVAHPGDTVVALHVLGNQDTVNGDGKSSLLSLVKAFDSVLAVYEGFCNLKQVDLKLKICRGSSVKKILVREANSYSATHVVVGTTHGLHRIRSSTVVAKYCAKKLSKDCSVLAVNNGKVVFKRDSSPPSVADLQGIDRQHRNGLVGSIHWTLSRNTKVLSDDNSGTDADEKKPGQISDHSLAKFFLDSTETVRKPSCSVCGTTLALPDPSCYQSAEGVSGDDGKENSLAIVPVQVQPTVAAEAELKPGWPLLHRRIISDTQSTDRSLTHPEISVVQWAMRLPSRNISYASDRDEKSETCDRSLDQPAALDRESGALVPVDSEIRTASSPESNSRNIPKELEGLHEKYSSTCRLFGYQDLVSATSNFLPENFIGKGGSSQVFRGCLPDGKELAVKILKPSEDGKP